MSTETIARWHAIPMTREQIEDVHPDTSTLSKRSRQDHDDDAEDSEDDNVSLVSRTPSPPPGDEMDIDNYDEHVRGAPREVITVDTKINSTNIGFAMLAKLGWSEGQPLGLSGDGRVDPIPFHIKNDLTGLGKMNQDFRMIETTVSQRRVLDSERQRKETEDQRKAREENAAKRAALKSEISDTLRPFYCTLCEKQFQNVAQYDEHTNSYAHHHKARLKDMQANARLVSQEDLEKRKEKERKREEKELRKLAKAQGIKMAKPTAGAAPTPAVLASENETAAPTETKPTAFKKAGWAAVTAVPESGFKRSGWATVNSAAASPSQPPPPPRDPTPPPPPPSCSLPTTSAPMFRAGGWTFLDTSGSQTTPFPQPPPAPSAASPPALPRDVPPPPPLPRYESQDFSAPPGPPRQSWASIPPSNPSQPPTLSSLRAPLPPPVAPARSGWQQWKQGSGSKRR